MRAELGRLGYGDGEAAQLTAPDLERASPAAEADLAWHLRAWGRRVLARVRCDPAARYPTYAEFEPRRRKGRKRTGRERRVRYRPHEPRLLAPDAEGRLLGELVVLGHEADLRAAGHAGRLGARLTTVVVEGQQGKEYRPPTAEEVVLACVGKEELDALHAEIPFGLPNEPICPDRPSPNSRGGRLASQATASTRGARSSPRRPRRRPARCSTPMSAEAPWRP